MTMGPAARKAALVAHVTSSVGWIGAVVVTLILGVVGLTSQDVQLVRGVYLAMEPIGWLVLLPFSVASLATGLIVSLGAPWGLFRHYWVVTKLLMNVFASLVLVLYTQTLAVMADAAAQANVADAGLDGLREPSPVIHSVLALLLLLVAAVLSVYKPRGMTRYGQRKHHEERRRAQQQGPEPAAAPSLLVP
jgi:hypothetical protein